MDVAIQDSGISFAPFTSASVTEYIYSTFRNGSLRPYISAYREITSVTTPASGRDGAITTFDELPVSPISSAAKSDALQSWIPSNGIANGRGIRMSIDRDLPLLAEAATRLLALAAKLDAFIPRPRNLSCPSRQDGKS